MLRPEDYAKRLREARREAGLSQSELARLAGTSQPAIARYELGRASPTTRTLAKLLQSCQRTSRTTAPSTLLRRTAAPLWISPARELEDTWIAQQLGPPGEELEHKSKRAAIESKWRARSVDVDRLIEVMRVGADERLRRFEDFVSDARTLRSQTKSSRRR